MIGYKGTPELEKSQERRNITKIRRDLYSSTLRLINISDDIGSDLGDRTELARSIENISAESNLNESLSFLLAETKKKGFQFPEECLDPKFASTLLSLISSDNGRQASLEILGNLWFFLKDFSTLLTSPELISSVSRCLRRESFDSNSKAFFAIANLSAIGTIDHDVLMNEILPNHLRFLRTFTRTDDVRSSLRLSFNLLIRDKFIFDGLFSSYMHAFKFFLLSRDPQNRSISSECLRILIGSRDKAVIAEEAGLLCDLVKSIVSSEYLGSLFQLANHFTSFEFSRAFFNDGLFEKVKFILNESQDLDLTHLIHFIQSLASIDPDMAAPLICLLIDSADCANYQNKVTVSDCLVQLALLGIHPWPESLEKNVVNLMLYRLNDNADGSTLKAICIIMGNRMSKDAIQAFLSEYLGESASELLFNM